MIYRAPGKIVLWGEYAVLSGAPAAVAAVDRYATVQLIPADNSWSFVSEGFLTPGLHNFSGRFTSAPVAAMAEQVLRHFELSRFPDGFSLASDTAPFYHQNADSSTAPDKYGLGSSAALCVATYCALADLLGRDKTLVDALAIHRAFQHGKGSGLDVGASWQGGYIRFQNGRVSTQLFPDTLYWRAVWTGASAATGRALGHFAQWQAAADTEPLERLAAASTLMSHEPSLANLTAYTRNLARLDDAANLNIFTPAHRRLATMAAAHGLVYKPCGAGGGDIGIAVGEDADALRQFCTQAALEEFVPLNLEIAPHGVQAH
ncbi:MAG: mevalonate kinase [bacterium]